MKADVELVLTWRCASACVALLNDLLHQTSKKFPSLVLPDRDNGFAPFSPGTRDIDLDRLGRGGFSLAEVFSHWIINTLRDFGTLVRLFTNAEGGPATP
jgi:hypothetical protein